MTGCVRTITCEDDTLFYTEKGTWARLMVSNTIAMLGALDDGSVTSSGLDQVNEMGRLENIKTIVRSKSVKYFSLHRHTMLEKNDGSPIVIIQSNNDI